MQNQAATEIQQAKIVKDHSLGTSSVHGVSFDGKDIWFASDDRLVAVDPDTGEIKRELSNIPSGAGTAFDGAYLWQIGGKEIRKIDLASGQVLHTIAAPDEDHSSGMAWADGVLWVGGYRTKKIYKIDPTTGKVLRTLESDRFVTGITWIDGELWHGTEPVDSAVDVRRIDPESGRTLAQVQINDGDYCSGVEADNSGRLWCGGKNRVRAIQLK